MITERHVIHHQKKPNKSRTLIDALTHATQTQFFHFKLI